ncbi:hypothetical protein [Nibricoccus aquaticus]|nr:hypothetical protein [Nibricoccus aquaticus]
MKRPTHLMIGGLVAMGFDASGRSLLTVSHSGRAVFAVETWQRVAHDTALAYPDEGVAIGIGPIEGKQVAVLSRDENKERIEMHSPEGSLHLVGESDGISVS